MRSILILGLALLGLSACDGDRQADGGDAPESAAPQQQAATDATPQRPADIPDGMDALPAEVPAPADNPTTDAKVALGKQLYFDPVLSASGRISCNSCHNLATSGVDRHRTSIGHGWQFGPRNAPTVLNAAFWSRQFWDGRAPTLEDQAKGPPLNPIEMGSESAGKVEARLREAGYGPRFREVFGDTDAALSFDNAAKAIAAFERTLVTPDAPFDRYVRGEGEISEAARRGMKKVAEIGCTSCHSGPLFTSNEFVAFPYGDDKGLASVTGEEKDDHVFRVQSWRNVAMTAPYFHDGSAATLADAVRIMAKVQLNTELTDAEVADIVAFLETLTGELPEITYPSFPRPTGRTLDWRVAAD